MIINNISITIYELYQWVKMKRLDVNPSYGRNLFWSDEEKLWCIDSLFKGYPLTPITVCELENSKMELVDGKQRIDAIVGYLDNKFVLVSDEEELNDKKFSEITDFMKRKIQDYIVHVMVVSDITMFEKITLYQLLNSHSNEKTEKKIYLDKYKK